MRRLAALLLALLPACAPVPGVPRAPAALLPPPELVPVAGLLAAGDALATLSSPAPELSAEAATLAGRAGGLTAPSGGAADPSSGVASAAGPGTAPDRAAALAARAAALRRPVLTDEERARLGQEPAPSLQ